MRLLVAAALAATLVPLTAADASCSLGQLGTNPWQCGPDVPEDERDAHTAVPCAVAGGTLTAAAYVPYAIDVTIECRLGAVVVDESHEGPVGYVTPWRTGSYDGPVCTTVSWWYPDYTQGSATYGC
ncbi:MAG TPA: hypothetical protein VNQ77_15245 [Frankiaceae bacterium]|nr:hypothetical protein [Frankiaceae bacterium]